MPTSDRASQLVDLPGAGLDAGPDPGAEDRRWHNRLVPARQVWASTGGNTISTGGEKILGSHVVQPFDLVDVSAWSARERVELIDKMGIWGQILYPNGVGFASNHIFAIEDDEERTTVLKIYNDFLADVQHESGERLLPAGPAPDLGHGPDGQGDDAADRQGHPRLHPVGQARDARPARAARTVLRPDVGHCSTSRARSPTSTSAAGNRREEMEALRSGVPTRKVGPGEIPPVAPPVWNLTGGSASWRSARPRCT